ncbi:GrpB family protein [Roseibium sp.]|uniref:GrpB family protein n=1 Tax=Roseibium sp. TaxID=1936156 RepID=UPI003B517B3C
MVELTDYQTVWADQFQDEAARISQVLGPNLVAIHHIGSTAVPGLVAKPIIDLMGEVNSLEACDAMNREMQFLGYEVMDAYGIPSRRYYRKFNSERRRTHHLHLFLSGSDHLTRHLAFRDYLIAHPEAAVEYGNLKRKLSRIDGGDWDSYVSGKDRFVQQTERLALDWYVGRR